MQNKPVPQFSPIGEIRSPFTERYEAPRQPGAEGGDLEAQIVLYGRNNFEQALEDLLGFEFIWIISWFHRNETWRPKVFPPRGPRKRRGVFATRSPYRPNPIGLSLASLVSIQRRTIRVRGIDLLDGTPVLDLKPYVPYADSRPGARIGWLEDVEAAGIYSVEWTPEARERMEWLRDAFNLRMDEAAERVLSFDPSPHTYRRIAARPNGRRSLAVKSWRLLFRVEPGKVIVENLRSGYPASVINASSPDSLHDHAAHVAFHIRFPEESFPENYSEAGGTNFEG